jgi:hypothetical protein
MTGNCDSKINSWYYDFMEGKCKELLYKGCNGNLNRFETQEACEYTCQGLAEPSIITTNLFGFSVFFLIFKTQIKFHLF